MKAKDLMIGDWVMHSTPTGPEPDKIDYFDGRIIVFKYNHRQYEADPIPITEEILKANGFVGSIRDCYKYNCGCYLIDVRCEVGEIDIFNEKGHYTSGYVCKSVNVDRFKYVHELQHALRLCGLNDLADNFKV